MNPAATASGAPVVEVRDLAIEFETGTENAFRPVDGVDFRIEPGEIVAIVGESGSGKSLTARALMRLLPHGGRVARGGVQLQGTELTRLSEREMRRLRGNRVTMVFQDPMTALNPVQPIGTQVVETIRLHRSLPRAAAWKEAEELLRRVGILDARQRMKNYPHEFSGGMRQRAVIAIAVANSPALLIADEPTTALDVTVQDQIMDLLRELNRAAGTSVLLISHNLAVVASLCRRILVMYAGRVVEEGPAAALFAAPEHPYTWSLLRSVPRIDRSAGRLRAIDGQPPDPRDMPTGCKFHPRCPFAIERCKVEEPPLAALSPSRKVRCWVTMSATGRQDG